jgi:hypothetical protein
VEEDYLGGDVVSIGMMKNAYKMLVGKPERKRLIERPRHRLENNIRVDLREMVWKSADWIHLAHSRDK